ncbi:MAG: hypothetical protein JXN64_10295 [Spirochaetes bacterium]|nr:hypothetical protein [Spirochaetota bacterium]
MKKTTIIFSVLLVALVYIKLSAEEADKEISGLSTATEIKLPEINVNDDFSGNIFFEFTKDFTEDDSSRTSSGSGKRKTFKIRKANVSYSPAFSDIFSARITAVIDEKKEESFLINEAYLQSLINFSFIGIKTKAGLIDTPNNTIIDEMSDYRWISDNYLLMADELINGFVIDHESDYGISMSLQVTKYFAITGAYTNGEGYTNNNEEYYDGKAVYGLMSITPIPHLYLNGYYRKEDVYVDEDTWYRGAGIAWSNDTLKAGLNYFYLSVKPGSEATQYTVYDCWVNINMQKIIGYPVLIAGRYASGNNKDEYYKAYIFEFGLGYQFIKNIKIMAYNKLRMLKNEESPSNYDQLLLKMSLSF